MKNELILKFDNRKEAMDLHNKINRSPVKASYIGGWVCIYGDVQLLKISDSVIAFKVADTRYVVNRAFLEDINFGEVE